MVPRANGALPHVGRAFCSRGLAAREAGQALTIAFNLSGHGYIDLAAYGSFLKGELENYAYPQDLVQEAMEHLPQVAVGGVRACPGWTWVRFHPCPF